MGNNYILIRLRDALDIKDTDMVEIFKLGGTELTEEEMRKMLVKIEEKEEPAPPFMKIFGDDPFCQA